MTKLDLTNYFGFYSLLSLGEKMQTKERNKRKEQTEGSVEIREKEIEMPEDLSTGQIELLHEKYPRKKFVLSKQEA